MKENTGYISYTYLVNISKLDVYFEYDKSIVFSVDSVERDLDSCYEENSQIVIITKTSIQKFDTTTEIRQLARENILTIQNVLSFILGVPLTVYNSYKSQVMFDPFDYQKDRIHITVNNIDYTDALLQILQKLNEEKSTILTVLDRWRKALYLKEESMDADLYYDESLLNFFHIMELFGESINEELFNKLNLKVKDLLSIYYTDLYYSDKQIDNRVNDNLKSINKILNGEKLSVSIKIKYFLDKYSLLDENVSYFIDNMVKMRNDIAHGKIIYQTSFNWPLSPFYNLAKNAYIEVNILQLLTANMISRYIGIKHWEVEWAEIRKCLLPSLERIKDFVENTHTYNPLDSSSLIEGDFHSITWHSLFEHYITNPRVITLKKLEKSISEYYISTRLSEENAYNLFEISCILSDSQDEELKKTAIKNICNSIENGWYSISDLRYMYHFLKFYKIESIWIKNFLEENSAIVNAII